MRGVVDNHIKQERFARLEDLVKLRRKLCGILDAYSVATAGPGDGGVVDYRVGRS